MKVAAGILFCVLFGYASCNDVFENNDEYIIGGREAQRGQFPFVASLRTHDNRHFCAATIINNRWVLTAAHCINARLNRPRGFRVMVGAHSRGEGTRYDVERMVEHPRFNRRTFSNDIMAIQTEKPIVFNNRVRALNLPRTNTLDQVPMLFAGWGLTGVSFKRIIFAAEYSADA